MEGRNSRHELVPGWRQSKLSEATVIVAGVGAIGNEVCRVLSLAGVGKLLICDPDVVSESNLSRCSLFSWGDIGRSKVEAAAETLKKIAPTLQIESRAGTFNQVIGLGAIRDASLVISCLDSNRARMELASRCNLVRTSYIDGGTHPWGGEIRLFWSFEEACFNCSNPNGLSEDQEIGPWSCSKEENPPHTGASILMTAVVGAWISNFAVRHLLDLSCPKGILRIDGETGVSQLVVVKRQAGCLFHEPLHEIPDRVNVSVNSSIEALLSELQQRAVPLLWSPAPVKYVCRKCRHESIYDFENPACSHCGSNNNLQFTYEYEILAFNKQTRLSKLGIPPKEILPYRLNDTIRYFEIK